MIAVGIIYYTHEYNVYRSYCLVHGMYIWMYVYILNTRFCVMYIQHSSSNVRCGDAYGYDNGYSGEETAVGAKSGNEAGSPGF